MPISQLMAFGVRSMPIARSCFFVDVADAPADVSLKLNQFATHFEPTGAEPSRA
jgi:hypothetical protein